MATTHSTNAETAKIVAGIIEEELDAEGIEPHLLQQKVNGRLERAGLAKVTAGDFFNVILDMAVAERVELKKFLVLRRA